MISMFLNFGERISGNFSFPDDPNFYISNIFNNVRNEFSLQNNVIYFVSVPQEIYSN